MSISRAKGWMWVLGILKFGFPFSQTCKQNIYYILRNCLYCALQFNSSTNAVMPINVNPFDADVASRKMPVNNLDIRAHNANITDLY